VKVYAGLCSGDGGHSHCPAPKSRDSYRSAAGVTGAAMLQRSQVNWVREQRRQGKCARVLCRARDCDCFRRRARRSEDMRKVDLRAVASEYGGWKERSGANSGAQWFGASPSYAIAAKQ
jgi:hypothetical protein